MHVSVVDLFSQMMGTKGLIKLAEHACLVISGGLVETLLAIEQELRSAGGRDEIQLLIFVNILGRGEPESSVFDHSASSGEVVIPAQEIGRLCLPGNTGARKVSRNVITVKTIVAVVRGGEAVRAIGAGLGDNIDDAA